MLDIETRLREDAKVKEELGFLKFFRYMLVNHLEMEYDDEGNQVGNDNIFTASHLVTIMMDYKEENYPEGIEE